MKKTGNMSGNKLMSIKKLFCMMVVSLLAFGAQGQVKWHTVAEASEATIGNRLYFVDFYTSWCGYCKKMDRQTFTDPTVAKILNTYYYPVKFDAESPEKVTWAGKTYSLTTSGRGRIHQFAAGVRGFPTFRLYRADGTPMQDIPGYYGPADFVVVLWYFASGDYNKYPFERYKQIFDKEIRPVMENKLKS